MAQWISKRLRLVFSASLALACGGRESESKRQMPIEPMSTVASASPAVPPSPAASSEPTAATETAAMTPELALPTASDATSAGCSATPADYIILGSRQACSARELPACGAGTQPFVDDCGCGCAGTPVFSRECRFDCQIPGSCPAARFEDFPSLSSTLIAWEAEMQADLQYSFGGWLVEGTCAGGQRFLYRSDHFSWEAYVFTSAGAFLALGTHGDSSGGTCDGAYFPEPTQCEAGTVTRVWVQDDHTPLNVGDPVTLP